MKRLNIFLLALVAIAAAGCKKYLDVNTNPNQPTKPPINGLLGRITNGTALNVYRVGDLVGNYVQYLASSNTASPADTYEAIDASSTWTNLYDVMTDAYDMEQLAIDAGSTQHQGVAKIVTAMNLQWVHDLWGDAPYSQAFNAETLTPTYDKAQDIFQTIIKLLDDGIALLQKPNSALTLDPSLDFIHKGKTSAWIKTAYALKARMLNHLSETQQYDPNAVLSALSNAYTSNSDDAQVSTFDVRNPWAQVARNNLALLLGGWLSDQFVNAMNGTTYGIFDPRLPLEASETKYNDYRGTRNGKGRVGSGINFEESYLLYGGFYSDDNSPLVIISYSELKFIEAEAKLRKNDKPGAYTAYLEGIRANMDKMGIPAAARDAYINDPSVSVGASNITIDLIMKEKYKALFLSPETWNDARRYDYKYKNFQMPLNAVTSTFIRRLVYPSVETSLNGKNVPSVTDVTQKLWWDQ
jgi:hypothetical protein